MPGEFKGVFSEQTIARYIGESLDLLGGARINVYVPALAHRFARERLRALAQSFLWEFILSAFLRFVIMAVATDTRAVGEAAAIAIGGTIGLDAMFGGPISGASMNPARSAGPAIVAGDLHALWIYLVAPVVGTAIGALVYQFVRPRQLHQQPRAASPGGIASRLRPSERR